MSSNAAEEGEVNLSGALEAILIVSDAAVDPKAIATALGSDPAAVTAALEGLARQYAADGRGFRLRHQVDGWRMCSAAEHEGTVRRAILESAPVRLTQAALETLAIIAYLQPISRGRISTIRGVAADAVVRTLVVRGLVDEAGRDEMSGAVLYRTTPLFLDRLGVDDITHLPSLADYLPDDEALAALMTNSEQQI